MGDDSATVPEGGENGGRGGDGSDIANDGGSHRVDG
jgi:hypothetical protein